MIHIEFLLEEPSMESFLKILLPKILPPEYKLGEHYFLRPHQGKNQLSKSIPRKMKVFSAQHLIDKVLIVVLQDQDSNDCKTLKNQLTDLCQNNGRCPFMIRIVCKELESWYFGDMEAVEKAFPRFKANKYRNKQKYRNPDEIGNPAAELSKILPELRKPQLAEAIAPHINISTNRSPSFQNFVSGLKRKLDEYESNHSH